MGRLFEKCQKILYNEFIMIKVLFFMDGIGNAGGIQEMAIKWMENIDRSKVKIDILT